MNPINHYTGDHETQRQSTSPSRKAMETGASEKPIAPSSSNCQLIFEHLDGSYLEKVIRSLSESQATRGRVLKKPGSEDSPRSPFSVLTQSLFTPVHNVNSSPDSDCIYRMTCFAKVGNEGTPLCGPGGELTALLDRFPDLKIKGHVESATVSGTIHGFEFTPYDPAPSGVHKSFEEKSPSLQYLEELSNFELENLIEDITAAEDVTPEKEEVLLAAAQLLVERTGNVWFYRLGTLSGKLAGILAHVGECLEIDVINSHDDEAGRHLAKCPGELVLPGLADLSEKMAEALGDRVGDLFLDGITTLTPTAAHNLSKHRGYLSLGSIYGAPPDVIRALGRHKGTINLRNLCEIPDSAAEGFSFHVGDLYLGKLTRISRHLAECLATNDGGLYLDSLATLSGEIAEALSHHSGELRLLGLQCLSDEACKHLGRHEGNLIFGRELNHVSVHGLKALAANRGDLHLEGLRTLCPEGAAALAKHRGALHLGGLTELDPGIAEILSFHAGPLSFSGVRNLCPDAARALSRHRGELRLKGLQALAHPTAGFLQNHSGLIQLGDALKDSPDVAVHLSCS